MRNKENDHLSKYYTNLKVESKIDNLLREINMIIAQCEGVDTSLEDQFMTEEVVKRIGVKIRDIDSGEIPTEMMAKNLISNRMDLIKEIDQDFYDEIAKSY